MSAEHLEVSAQDNGTRGTVENSLVSVKDLGGVWRGISAGMHFSGMYFSGLSIQLPNNINRRQQKEILNIIMPFSACVVFILCGRSICSISLAGLSSLREEKRVILFETI